MNYPCEYRRCGGMGRRTTAEAVRREARVLVEIAERTWKVCESCADLLIRTKTAEGFPLVEKVYLDVTPPQSAQTAPEPIAAAEPLTAGKQGRPTEESVAQEEARRSLEKAGKRFLAEGDRGRSFESIAEDVTRRLTLDGRLKKKRPC